MNYFITSDVPQLDEGLKFYCDALDHVEVSRSVAAYATLKGGSSQIGLIKKQADTKPAMGSDYIRRQLHAHFQPLRGSKNLVERKRHRRRCRTREAD